MLERARAAHYTDGSLKDLPEGWRSSFDRVGEDYVLRAPFREGVELRQADVRGPPPAERFRLNTGRLPTSPDEMVSDYLDEWPMDPFDGQPMRFAINDDGIVIYSVNDDATDDGGSVAPTEGEKLARDVGFRLFKMDRRGLLIIDESVNPDE